ncbi:hypothetical protein MMC09_006861 [Bachmanniomyces sp. S44760]|nr:hypothetical protein [Bachmanniomyces sp. S44760]
MARTSPTHWVGVFFLLAATVLLVITSISAPVIGDIAILKVMLTNKTDLRNSSVTFGTFGHCILDVPPVQTDQDFCFPKVIGYQPASIMASIDGTGFSRASAGTADDLTPAMVLHPVCALIAFIAFCLSIGAGVIGSILGASVAFVAWILTLVIMAIDFSLFGIIKNHVNSDGSGSHAYFSVGMWTLLAAMILLFLGTFIVLFTCFSARKERRNTYKSSADTYDNGYSTTHTRTTRRKRFGLF